MHVRECVSWSCETTVCTLQIHCPMLNGVGEHSPRQRHKDDIVIGRVDADRFDMVVAPMAGALAGAKPGLFVAGVRTNA